MNDAEFAECVEKCKEKHGGLDHSALVSLIQSNGCSNYSDQLLAQNFTKSGLLSLLCSCLCGEREESGRLDEKPKKPEAPELVLNPPTSTKKA